MKQSIIKINTDGSIEVRTGKELTFEGLLITDKTINVAINGRSFTVRKENLSSIDIIVCSTSIKVVDNNGFESIETI